MATLRPPVTTQPPVWATAEPPLWVRLGPVVELWAEPGAEFGPYISARRRWRDAKTRWVAAAGIPPRTAGRLRLDKAPWSLGDPTARERLARLGLSLDDLPALGRAASEWITAPRGHRP